MAERMTSRLRERIAARIADTERKAAEVSRAAGYGPDFIRDFLTDRKKSIGADAQARIARELGVTVAWLQGEGETPELAAPAGHAGIPRTVPVFGTAAGASEGALHVTTDVIEWLPCPAALANVRDVYALYVVGTSMLPRFRQGEALIVAPHRPVRGGDDVVIQVRRGGGTETESWVKEYVREAEGMIVTRQHNPPREVVFDRHDVVEMHRIIPPNELLGL